MAETLAQKKSRIKAKCRNIAREKGLNRQETRALIKATTKSLLGKA